MNKTLSAIAIAVTTVLGVLLLPLFAGVNPPFVTSDTVTNMTSSVPYIDATKSGNTYTIATNSTRIPLINLPVGVSTGFQAGANITLGNTNGVTTITAASSAAGLTNAAAGPYLSVGVANGVVTFTNTYRSYCTSVVLSADINPSVAATFTNLMTMTVPQITGAIDGGFTLNYRTDGSGVPNFITYQVLVAGGGTVATNRMITFSRDVQNNGNANHWIPFFANLTTNVTVSIQGKVDSASAGDVWTAGTANNSDSTYTNQNASAGFLRYFPTAY